jgi:hypothetical protein
MTVVDAMNPFGGTESVANLVFPTAVDPVIDLLENRDYADRPVYKEASQYGTPTPDSSRYFSTASPSMVKIAEVLNDMTGGTSEVSGLLDVSQR